MKSEHGQAMPEETIHLGKEAFGKIDETVLYWLGEAFVLRK